MPVANDPFSGVPRTRPRPQRSGQEADPQPASEKQVSYIHSLVDQRDINQLNGFLYERVFDLTTGREKFVSKREASDLITALKELPKNEVTAEPSEEPPEGIHYFHPYEDESIEIFKVQVAHQGSGRLYAKKLNKETGKFEYHGRKFPFHCLSEISLLTVEKAKEFGDLYGMCAKCGATLTNEESIERGIGPICAKGL